jgi:signal transduction histidine kinase/CheY-like chemotaxis protein
MSPKGDDNLRSLRERLVIRVSRYVFFAGLVPLAFVVWHYHLGTVPGVAPAVDLAALLGVAWASFGRLSLWARTSLTLGALAVVAIYTAVLTGFAPATMGSAAGLCLLAACLLKPRAAQIVSVTSPLVLMGVGLLHVSGTIHAFTDIVDLRMAINWWRAASTLITLTLPPVLAIVMHIDSLDRAVRQRTELIDQAVREEYRRHVSVQAHAEAEAERRRAQGLMALGRLGGGFAHEINNKLQAIRGEIDMLRLEPAAGIAEIPEAALGDMLEAVEGAAAVMRRLLTLSGREVDASRCPVELPSFLRVARRQLAQIRGLTVVTESEPDLVASADAPSLHAVLLNLGLNARDAMGGRGTVKLRARRASDAERDTGCVVAIDVIDTGVGMDGRTLSRLFEPLFTTKGSAGTGLGLAGVRRVLEAAGGRLRVESAVGRGTTFTILLPAAERSPPPVSEDLPPPTPGADAGCVLVTDDDEAVRRAFRCALERQGYRVLCAKDVSEAVNLVASHSVDLAWMDAVMPGRPTRDLIAELRRVQPGARLVVCSGHVEEELLRRDLRSGEVEFVAKPCSLAVLLEHARHAVAARRREPGV